MRESSIYNIYSQITLEPRMVLAASINTTHAIIVTRPKHTHTQHTTHTSSRKHNYIGHQHAALWILFSRWSVGVRSGVWVCHRCCCCSICNECANVRFACTHAKGVQKASHCKRRALVRAAQRYIYIYKSSAVLATTKTRHSRSSTKRTTVVSLKLNGMCKKWAMCVYIMIAHSAV